MTTIETLKSQAKRLRAHLSESNIPLTHSQVLEAVAVMHGHRDWNTASAIAGPPAEPVQERQPAISLKEFLNGVMRPSADIGPADVQIEGTYRRGYHQCAAELMHVMRGPKQITAAMLEEWVEGAGMEWRKDKPLNRMILAPGFVATREEK
ncbi:glyoxalase superfamily protein (plasmid) [Pseudomonas sp. HR96]|uniref:glyoxalase superfamily protein n=1 Tax=Pseudomonas sp. HR96 TaxID=1027966 RepID=UPI002A747E9A|nr:glyoxalase superfamily protein [Pseudomonas sp. HR96]WPP02521.1 glyoxalase superfamily protein [Pseudomonas sp. HR96]